MPREKKEIKDKKVPVRRSRRVSADGPIAVKRRRNSQTGHILDLSSEEVKITAAPIIHAAPSYDSAERSPLRLYKKIAVTFIIFAILTLAVVSYFAMVRLDINLTPRVTPIAAAANFTVYDRPETYELPSGSVLGIVREMDIEYNGSYKATSESVTGAQVSGTVTIVNKYSKDQPLIATTRLLSSTNQLLRLTNAVVVPAGGSVEAQVYGETADPTFTLSDSRLTIPGLWAGLQDKIYAEAKVGEVSYKETKKYAITQTDLDQAISEGKKALLAESSTDIQDVYSAYDEKMYKLNDESITFSFDAKAGDEKENFNMKMSGKVVVVAFKKASIGQLDQTALDSAVEGKQEIVENTQASSSFELVSADINQNIAELKLNVAAQAATTTASDIVDRQKLVGLTRSQVESYLDSLGTIESYELKFKPSFFEIAPQLVDRITVNVK